MQGVYLGGLHGNLRPTANKNMKPSVLQPQDTNLPTKVGSSSVKLQMKPQPWLTLTAALWDVQQMTQISCVQIPDQQKLWDNKYVLFKPLGLWEFVMHQ